MSNQNTVAVKAWMLVLGMMMSGWTLADQHGAGASVDGQPEKECPSKHRLEKKVGHMKTELGLSDEQTEKVREILKKKKEKMKKVKAETREELSSVLDAKQLEKFDEMKKKHHHKKNYCPHCDGHKGNGLKMDEKHRDCPHKKDKKL